MGRDELLAPPKFLADDYETVAWSLIAGRRGVSLPEIVEATDGASIDYPPIAGPDRPRTRTVIQFALWGSPTKPGEATSGGLGSFSPASATNWPFSVAFPTL
ncbi:hypothetical protein [Actinokineospora sp. HUAS TT18]|uniref:hypothetical protein n=1 Tax=Actinokineospora sp. HUAS TT18 TaxID=3447451 RepID=UPI003F51C128